MKVKQQNIIDADSSSHMRNRLTRSHWSPMGGAGSRLSQRTTIAGLAPASLSLAMVLVSSAIAPRPVSF
jgi:hypothetical protein